MNKYQHYLESLGNISSPALFLDLEAFEKNIQWIIQNSNKKNIRISTKSIRSVEILKRLLKSSDVFQGLMTFTLKESLWLRNQGFKNILLGFPTTDKDALKELAKNPEEIILMVDLPEHLMMLEKIASEENSFFNFAVDFDLAMDLPGLKFGVYRSSLGSLSKLKNFLEVLKNCPHLKLVATMGYEAQIAAINDKNQSIIRILKYASLPQLQKRRSEMIKLVESYQHKIKFNNGGGTGSLLTTSTEEVVTEVTIGSAFYAPTLFDFYQDFTLTPAMFFTLPVVRHAQDNIFTCLGGGYTASGSAENNKLPTPYLPQGIALTKHEAAGEVQTPIINNGDYPLKVGDLIVMRHAKAGEICERFNEIHFIDHSGHQGSCLTYRGEGKAFL